MVAHVRVYRLFANVKNQVTCHALMPSLVICATPKRPALGRQRPEAVQEVPARDQGGEKGPVDGDGEGQEGAPDGWGMVRLENWGIFRQKNVMTCNSIYIYI